MKINGKEYRTIWFESNIVKIIESKKISKVYFKNVLNDQKAKNSE